MSSAGRCPALPKCRAPEIIAHRPRFTVDELQGLTRERQQQRATGRLPAMLHRGDGIFCGQRGSVPGRQWARPQVVQVLPLLPVVLHDPGEAVGEDVARRHFVCRILLRPWLKVAHPPGAGAVAGLGRTTTDSCAGSYSLT